ncbi:MULTISPECIES: hypothetical protein [unclassified Psychrobacter]|jgi:hypothetical protein|uniref:hypothetical protein n=1 Tax=unclassified Psychrobacter TaxID=196806 RepID=UPI003FD1A5DE
MKAPDYKGVFASPNAQIADSFNVYRQKPPPEDHPNAIVCVQCDELTWRLTDCCIHCGFNMDAYAQELIRLENLDQLRFEQQQLKKKILPLLILMLVLAGGVALAALLTDIHPFAYWILIGGMVTISIFIKPLVEKIENTRHQIRELQ